MSARAGALLAAIGDANDIRTWSGIPYHLLQEGLRQGVLVGGLPLSTTSKVWTLRRALWNGKTLALGHGLGGYQYSEEFLARLWAPFSSQLSDRSIINCFQLYPSAIVERYASQLWFNIDQTLRQLFDSYGVARSVGQKTLESALKREKMGYEACAGIVVHSRWAADSLTGDYGIDSDKVHCIVPGANLEIAAYRAWAAQHVPTDPRQARPLRLVFVGKEPYRKGLDRLLAALSAAQAHGVRFSLCVIGCMPEAVPAGLRNIAGVEWLGFVDKSQDLKRYLDLLGECDIGCLLSRAEAGGIGLREFHACGLAVLGPRVGGSPDHVIAEAAVLVDPDQGLGDIAELLLRLDANRGEVARLKDASFASRERASWAPAVTALGRLLAGHSPDTHEFDEGSCQ